MLSLSLWRGSRSGSSERTTSTNTNADSNTTEASWIPSGKSSLSGCESALVACSALPETKRLVVKQAIKSLFEKRHFDICIVREVAEIVGARSGGDAFQILRALHCVDYASMEPELRARIPELVNECLRQQDNVIEATDVALKGIV